MRKDSPLAEKESINAKDLLGIPIIAPYSIMNYNNFLKWMGNDFEKLNIVAFFNLIFNASLLVEEGANYAICVNDLVNTTGNSNLCFKPLTPKIALSSVLVWKKYQIFSKPSQKFLDELKKIICKTDN